MPKRTDAKPSPKSEGVERLKLHLNADHIEYLTEVQFHPARKWRFDFVVGDVFSSDPNDRSLAVEVDGGNRMVRIGNKSGKPQVVGRHTGDKDYEKLCEAAILGWRIIRVSREMVKSGYAIDAIKRALK